MPPVVGAKRGKLGTRPAITRCRKGSRSVKALPLKYFNVRTAERFVFKRRDKRCLTQSPRSSLIPVFIHFSDIFPDQVQGILNKCKSIIMSCPRVLLLKPCTHQDRPLADDIVFDGPGTNVPDRCWERQSTLLRTLDIVQYKVEAPDRKRALLPVERDLWNVVEPFLCRIRKFVDQLNQDAIPLDDLRTADDICSALNGERPWCININSSKASAIPAVGDRAHTLFFNPKAGVFTRKFMDAFAVPLVTLPCRLKTGMPLFPSVPKVLEYLDAIRDRIPNPRAVELLHELHEKHPVVEETSPPEPGAAAAQGSPAIAPAPAAQRTAAEGGDGTPEHPAAASAEFAAA